MRNVELLAVIKIQALWRMYLQKRKYESLLYDYHAQQQEDDESCCSYDTWDACEADFESRYHAFHCGGY